MAKRKPVYECGRDDCPGTTGTSHRRDACERVITERVWYGRQSVNLERIVAIGDKRVRYLVEVDAYDFQSSARAELWNGEKWHRVHYIPGPEVLTGKMVSYVTKGVTARAFAGDLAELERVVKAVIS